MKWRGRRTSTNLEDARDIKIAVEWVDGADQWRDDLYTQSGYHVFYRDGYIKSSPNWKSDNSGGTTLQFERWQSDVGPYLITNVLSDGQRAALRAFLKPYSQFRKVNVLGDDGSLVEKVQAMIRNSRG